MNPLTPHRILLVAFVALSASATLAGEPAGLSAWVGKHPFDQPVPGRGPLLAQPRLRDGLRDGLRQLLPPGELALLPELDVESQVRQVGDFLVIDQCKPHDCPAQQAMIVVDLKSDRLWAAFFTRSRGRVATRWYGNVDDEDALPQEIRTDVLRRHGSVAP